MSVTRGGQHQRKRFDWQYDSFTHRVKIENEEGRIDQFTLDEIGPILHYLDITFGRDYFPLRNNVARLGNDTEEPGLGQAIMHATPGDATHGQAASYLGVVLEESGFFVWNGEHNGIAWRIVRDNLSPAAIVRGLTGPRKKDQL